MQSHRHLVLFLAIMLSFSMHAQTPEFGWLQQVGNARGSGVTVDPSGNIYTTGTFEGTTDFDPGPGVFNLTSGSISNIFITKYDPMGNLIWARHLFSTNNGSKSYGIALDGTGNVVIAGAYGGTIDCDPGPSTFNLTSGGSADILVCKLDQSGNFLWAKSMGGTGGDSASSLAIDASGNVFTTGFFATITDFDPGVGVANLTSLGFEDIFISKLTSAGDFVYAKQMGGTGNDQKGHTIAVDNAGNVIITGVFDSAVDFDPGAGTFNLPLIGGLNGFITKLDNLGNFVWAKLLGGQTSLNRGATIVDATGNIYSTGFFGFPSDFDTGPGVLTLTPGGNNDMFVNKLDPNGDLVWVKQMVGATGTTNSLGESITMDSSGNIYTVGLLSGTVDFDPGAGTANLTSTGASFQDIVLSKLDASGNFVWAGQMGSSGSGETGVSIALDNAGNVFTTGQFSGTSDFDPSPCTVSTITAIGTPDAFICKTIQSNVPAPTITGFTPSVGPIGTSVTITGTNFSAIPANNVVKFFNDRTATVTASTATTLTTTVPTGTTTGKVSVTTNCITVVSAIDFVIGSVIPPTITSFTPASGAIGTTVTITGTNFSTTPANNIVYFGATQANVTAATLTQLTVTVPIGATYAPLSVSVNSLMAYSNEPFITTFGSSAVIDACAFAPKQDISVGMFPVGIATGDFDIDGKADMAVANFDNNVITVSRNTSSVGTISYETYTRCCYPRSHHYFVQSCSRNSRNNRNNNRNRI